MVLVLKVRVHTTAPLDPLSTVSLQLSNSPPLVFSVLFSFSLFTAEHAPLNVVLIAKPVAKNDTDAVRTAAWRTST
jgi:hypothetical protein